VCDDGVSTGGVWCRLKRYCSILCAAVAVITFILSFPIMFVSFTYSSPKFNILAVAGDTIDCSGLDDSWHRVFYSSVSITQTASDPINDNRQGLAMSILPLDRRDLKFHSRNFSGSTADVTLHKNTQTILIPDEYYNQPLYMWAGSNVTFSVTIDYKTLPTEMTAYIILGDNNLNSFYSDPSVSPRYEHKFNLLEDGDQLYQHTFYRDSYYYIVVRVHTDENVNFSAQVQFDYFAIDKEDYEFDNARHLSTVDWTLFENLDIRDRKLVVCALDNPPDSFSANTVHIDLAYRPRASVVYVLPLALLLLFVLLFVFLCLKLLYSRQQSRAPSSNQYHKLNHKLNGINS